MEQGGTLQLIRRELEVFCLPDQIPEHITIDITDLDIGDSIHVEELPLEGDVEIPADVNFTILTISQPDGRRGRGGVEGEEEEARVKRVSTGTKQLKNRLTSSLADGQPADCRHGLPSLRWLKSDNI